MAYWHYIYNPMLGQRLKSIRKIRLLSLNDLSNKTGLSVNAISEIERGITAPRETTIKKILEALNVDEKILYSQDELKLTDTLLPNNITDRKIDDVNLQIQNLKEIVSAQEAELKSLRTGSSGKPFDKLIHSKQNEELEKWLTVCLVLDEKGVVTAYLLNELAKILTDPNLTEAKNNIIETISRLKKINF